LLVLFPKQTLLRFQVGFTDLGAQGLFSPAWRLELGLKGRGMTKMGRTAPVEETSRISGFGTFGASTTGKVLRFLLMAWILIGGTLNKRS